MRKILTILLSALILASAISVEGKNQNVQQKSNINNEIKGGHHNTIISDVDQISQIEVGNNKNVPYGQLKKIGGFGTNDGASNIDLTQIANINNQILGGHHNTIVVDNSQAAFGYLDPTSIWWTGDLNLNQKSIIDNQIASGHHNTILVGSTQQAYMNPMSLGDSSTNVNQIGYINNQILGGHHNTISVYSDQIVKLGSIVEEP